VEVRTFTGGGFGENAYLVVSGSALCVVVDPGADAPRIADAIVHEDLDVAAILLTHAHIDHVEGIHDVRRVVPEVPIWLHAEAMPMYRAMPHQAARFGLRLDPLPDPTDEWAHGFRFELGHAALDTSRSRSSATSSSTARSAGPICPAATCARS
jgi:glyoxylase-like metal-dependent hydrolase (beta-lactamase superfamily II)